jgi:hypothetical protein
MKEIQIVKDFSSKINNPFFYDRLYAVIQEHGNDLNYGEYCAKVLSNGCIKVLKSLGLYKVMGKGETKKAYIHDMVYLVYNTTVADHIIIANNIVKLFNGEFADMEKIYVKDKSAYNLLSTDYPYSSNSSKCTYVFYNPCNNLYKIGKSRDVFYRLNQLKKEVNPLLELIGWIDRDIEYKLHKEYIFKRRFGEWFNINNDDILDIKNNHNLNIVKMIEYNIKIADT